jgi:hypothetical protein
MEFHEKKLRIRHAKLLGDKIKNAVKLSDGVFERSYGNTQQSGWPAYFFYHKQVGMKWVQTLAPGAKLNWQKVARFRLWTRYSCPIYVVDSYDKFKETIEGVPNWHLWINHNKKEFKKGEDRTKEIEENLPEPPRKKKFEQEIADRIQWKLEEQGWLMEKTYGNPYQIGWPDYFLFHPEHGYKWLETKRPGGKLRPTQTGKFNKWESKGVKVWVLDSEDKINLLFNKPNWRDFPSEKWKIK